jgi:DNA-binding MarR family transcriptional regulator
MNNDRGASEPLQGLDGADAASRSEITLRLLEAVESDANLTQRRIAGELGIALGLVNVYLKRCVRKGWVKISTVPARRYAYYLTPQGFGEKARLTSFYLSQSFRLFRGARTEYAELMGVCQTRGWKHIGLYGISDLSEVAVLCAAEREMPLTAIIDPTATQTRYLGLPVSHDLAEARRLDALVLTTFNPHDAWARLADADLGGLRVLSPPLLGPNLMAERL